MSLTQEIIIISVCVIGTILTRCLPFLIFSSKKPTPAYVQYLGKALPSAIFGMLVIYCLKDISIFKASHGIPELLSIVFVCILHLWKRQMLVSIAGGTILYMLLIQFVFL